MSEKCFWNAIVDKLCIQSVNDVLCILMVYTMYLLLSKDSKRRLSPPFDMGRLVLYGGVQ